MSNAASSLGLEGAWLGVDREDEGLVARAREGDSGAFADLCERHRERVWRVIASVAHGPEVEDLAQEAILRAFTSIRKFRGDAPFGAWLCRIALNIAHDHLRSAWRRKVILFVTPPEQVDEHAECPAGET